MAKKSVFRALSAVSVSVLIVIVLIAGYKTWSTANERTQTAVAFRQLRSVDKRVDLSSVIPHMTRTESGLAVRLGGSGEGPSINYSFVPASDFDWQGRLDVAMRRAGYGNDDDGAWTIHVRGYPVLVLTTGPDAPSGTVRITISGQ